MPRPVESFDEQPHAVMRWAPGLLIAAIMALIAIAWLSPH
jgi:hypothetical protein